MMCIDGGTWEKKLKTKNPKINQTLILLYFNYNTIVPRILFMYREPVVVWEIQNH